jgi:hypothetical protein
MWSTIRTIIVCVSIVASVAIWRDAKAATAPVFGTVQQAVPREISQELISAAGVRTATGSALRSISVGY